MGKYGFIPGEWSMDPSDGKKIHGAKEYLRGAKKQGRKRQEEWTTILERWRKDDLYLTNQSWTDHWVREVFGPKKTRPNFTEAVETAKTISKEEWRVPDLNQCLPRTTARAISKEEWNMPQIPVQERERLNDTLDPKAKEHLTWLSKNWPSFFFKETEESSSSATSWSRPSSRWDQSWSDRHQWKEWQKNKIGGNENVVMVSTWLLETGGAHVPWVIVPAFLSQSFLRVDSFIQFRV